MNVSAENESYKAGYRAALLSSRRVCVDGLKAYYKDAQNDRNGDFSRGLRDGLYFAVEKVNKALDALVKEVKL